MNCQRGTMMLNSFSAFTGSSVFKVFTACNAAAVLPEK
jgi:hypothetical protein